MEIKKYIAEKKRIVDQALDKYLPKEDADPKDLAQAMRYTIFAGGKRFRPLICLAACEAVSGRVENALPVACSIELIHVYSLIHDDLPAMDNDDFRRGKPASHKVFGEGVAILAGNALASLAFEIIVKQTKVEKERVLSVLAVLAEAIGFSGMIGGQAMDIAVQGKKGDPAETRLIAAKKTGALIAAAVRAGAMIGGAPKKEENLLTEYGKHLGLAFQITDDILDIGPGEKPLGFARGKGKGKRELAQAEGEKALAKLSSFDKKAEPLRELVKYVLGRKE